MKNHTITRLDERGEITTAKIVLVVILLILLSVAAVKIGPPFFNYQMVKSEIKNEAKNAFFYSDEELREHIIDAAEEWDVELNYYDIEIKRGFSGQDVEVTVKWEDYIDFFGQYDKELYFEVYTKQPIVERERL